jgi:hypothetical protein
VRVNFSIPQLGLEVRDGCIYPRAKIQQAYGDPPDYWVDTRTGVGVPHDFVERGINQSALYDNAHPLFIALARNHPDFGHLVKGEWW